MWQLIYDMLMNPNVLGGASNYEATSVLARYIAYGGTIAILIGVFVLIFVLFSLIKKVFRG